ncbi:uncharacterized protein LOC107792071 isoform X3 [Nicotiana tabacum]|uniref:uncharacterized protein LOC107792071 isoform X3 n=1 Tax=Nicotiana tabacum TaxID=4097 RepID=UPI003F4EED84
MYPERRNKWPYAEHPNSDKNVRRHDIYGQISPDKKETMLLQRRTKELERQKWNSSIKSTVDPDERVMYQCHPMIRKDSALTITEASSADDEVGSKHDVILPQVLWIKEKMSVMRLLYLKEDQHRVYIRDNIMSSLLPHAKKGFNMNLLDFVVAAGQLS